MKKGIGPLLWEWARYILVILFIIMAVLIIMWLSKLKLELSLI